MTGISRAETSSGRGATATANGRLKTANWQQRPATASIMKIISADMTSLDLDPGKIEKLSENEEIAKLLFLHFYQMDTVPTRALELGQKLVDSQYA